MAEQRIINGWIYEKDAQGNIVPVGPAPAAAPQISATPLPRNPATVAKEAAAAAERAADNARAEAQLRLSQAASARGASAEMRAAEKAELDRREWLATHNPDGSPKPTANSIKPTEVQGKAAAFLIRALGANRAYSDTGVGARNIFAQALQDKAPNLTNELLNASPQQVANSAQDEFIAASLRQDSGAAIPPEEMERQRRIYFPMPGDGPAAIKQKEQARARAIAGLDMLAGPLRDQAYQRFNALEKQNSGKSDDTPDDPLAAMQGGQSPAGGGANPGFASGGATEKSIAIPQQMQQEHAAFLQKNWGRIDPEAYAGFRATLDHKYGFEPRPDAYRAIVPDLNKRAQQGGSPAGLDIPPVNARMDGIDQVNASLFNNSVGGLAFGVGDQLGLADEMAGGVRSLINGTDYDVEVARADAMKQAMGDAYGTENVIGNIGGAILTGGALAKAAPGLTGALTNTTGRAIGTGSAFGALTGAGETNDNRALGGMYGAALGVLGGGAGAAASPLIRGAMGTQAGQAISRGGRAAWNNTAGRVPGLPTVAPAPIVPQMAKGEALLPAEVLENAIPNLQDADRLGLPYALADADPKLRMLAGSVARRSADARQLGENTFEPRARGQADRLVKAIDVLAPITDIKKRSGDLMKAGSTAAEPYYTRAYAQNALDDPVVQSILGTPSGQDAMKRAYRIAADERRDPTAMGFVLDETTGGVQINQDGRFIRPEMPHEKGLISGKGNRAPDDLISFVRQNGGLKNQSGELSHMGLTNAPRKGVPFAGQDTRWGPLVSENGRNLDDMGEAAFEAGFFNERPTTAEFLDALRDTHDGVNRRFRPEDQAIVSDYFARQESRYAASGDPNLVVDTSQPAGPRDFAPPEAYGRDVALPTYQTMHMVKRGFDDVVEDNRDAFGKLDLSGKPVAQGVNRLRGELNTRLGELNPDYAKGNEVYSRFAKRRDALDQGYNLLPRNNVPFRDFEETVGRARAYDDDFRQSEDRLIPELQRGYATNMADTADKMRLSGNPYEAVYGAPVQQRKVSTLFPEGAADFGRTYNLERDMLKTAYEVLGGSPTAMRQATDQQFDADGLGMAGNIAADMAGGGGMFTARGLIGRGMRALGDTARIKGGKSKADAIAPVLFKDDPRLTLDYLADLQERQALEAERARKYRTSAGLFGAILPSTFLGSE